MQIREIVSAKWLREYEVELTFDTLEKGLVDLKPLIGRGVFKPLLKLAEFKKFRVDAELGTIVWPNGADMAPHVLYDLAKKNFSSKKAA